jgi:hypothetical protein
MQNLLIKKFIKSLSQKYEVFDIPRTKFGAAGCKKLAGTTSIIQGNYNNPR